MGFGLLGILLKVKIVLHEANGRVGKAVRLLQRFAYRVYLPKSVMHKEIKKSKKERKKKKSKKTKIFGQKFNSTEDYVKFFAPIAMDEMIQYKIPASITLAQGILESVSYTHLTLPTKA